MELEFKPDFDAAADRWDAFWRGENPRPLIKGTIPKPGTTPVEKPGVVEAHGRFRRGAPRAL